VRAARRDRAEEDRDTYVTARAEDARESREGSSLRGARGHGSRK
jgi:hypothetical protein